MKSYIIILLNGGVICLPALTTQKCDQSLLEDLSALRVTVVLQISLNLKAVLR